MAKIFEDFKRLYPLSKTLRFEAKPIGATLDNIVKSGLLDEDEHRAASYVKVKKLIDEYHKVFIDKVLADGCLPLKNEGHNNSLTEYYDNYVSKSQNEDVKKAFEENQQKGMPDLLGRILGSADAWYHQWSIDRYYSLLCRDDHPYCETGTLFSGSAAGTQTFRRSYGKSA